VLLEEAFALLVARDGVTLLNRDGQLLFVAFELQQLVLAQLAPGDLGGADLLPPLVLDRIRAG